MFQYRLYTLTLLTILSVLSIRAQSNPDATCQTATGMSNVNASMFVGDWYEEVRAPALNVSCVHVHVDIVNNNTLLNIKTMYSASQSGLLMDQTAQTNVKISEVNANSGFNASYINGTVTTYKILSANYSSYVVLCGYTSATNASSSFGIILTRNQIANSSWLMDVKQNASQILSGFNDNSTANITQSKSCYASSAATSVPMLATLFAAFYALLKVIY